MLIVFWVAASDSPLERDVLTLKVLEVLLDGVSRTDEQNFWGWNVCKMLLEFHDDVFGKTG